VRLKVRKRLFCVGPFYTKNDRFTKTGSGQTDAGKALKKER
jgi:hypothetical protein